MKSFFGCPFFPQFQKSIFSSLDLDLPFLDFRQFPGIFPLSLCLSLFSMVNALPSVSLFLFHHISLLRITPTTSSNFRMFEPETKLLTSMTNMSHISSNEHCWCNYLHNILPNINYQPRFVISRFDALYVPIIDRFLCLMSIVQSRKPSKKPILCFHTSKIPLFTRFIN
jgi:hypothetical protein